MLDSLVRVTRRVGDRHFVKHRARNYTSVGATARNGRRERGLRREPLRPHEFLRLPTDADTGRAEPARPLLPAAASLLAISSPLHSLFKVLCIFPSRYLFAIGLLLIFRFRWNFPPTLSCTRKQLDSLEAGRSPCAWVRTGLAPSVASHSMEVVPGASAWRHSSRLQFGRLPTPIFKLSSSLFTRRY